MTEAGRTSPGGPTDVRHLLPRVLLVQVDHQQSSVKGLVQLLEDTRALRTAHRVVHNREQLLKDLSQSSNEKHRLLSVCYLAFQGLPGTLHAGDDEVTLHDLAKPLTGRCAGRRLHLGGCSTGAVQPDQLQEFRRLTGAQWVSAYTTDIDWIEGAALDLLVLDWLAYTRATPVQIRKELGTRSGDLARQLGLTAVTRKGVAAVGA